MRWIAMILLPSLTLGLWTGLSASAAVDPLFLPPPWKVAQAIVVGITSGALLKDMTATVLRSLTGFVIAGVLGVPLGLLIGRSRFLTQATQPTIDFFRSIPATAL